MSFWCSFTGHKIESRLEGIRLSELAGKVQDAVSMQFANRSFWVIGEVTSYSHYAQKNHHYFELVEKSNYGSAILAKMQAAAFSPGNMAIKRFERETGQKFKNDIQVLARVVVEFHHVYGLKLILQDIDSTYTLGALEQQKQATLARLLKECSDCISIIGERYITTNNRLPLPLVIQNIAVLSSGQSAGLQDFMHTIESNDYGYTFKVDLYDTFVQGEANADILCNKLVDIFISGIPYDAVAIIRGGGAQTDFLLFDQFVVGKAVAKFPIPVITGIGHQKNETVADLMAHTPTKTPTKAAEFIIAHNAIFEIKTRTIQQNLVIKAQQLLSGKLTGITRLNTIIVNGTRTLLTDQKERLADAKQRLTLRSNIILTERSNSLKNQSATINLYIRGLIRNKHLTMSHFSTLIKSMTPENILKKGFAIVKVNNKIVTDTTDVKIGRDISVILSKTEVVSTVKSKSDYNESEFDI